MSGFSCIILLITAAKLYKNQKITAGFNLIADGNPDLINM